MELQGPFAMAVDQSAFLNGLYQHFFLGFLLFVLWEGLKKFSVILSVGAYWIYLPICGWIKAFRLKIFLLHSEVKLALKGLLISGGGR